MNRPSSSLSSLPPLSNFIIFTGYGRLLKNSGVSHLGEKNSPTARFLFPLFPFSGRLWDVAACW